MENLSGADIKTAIVVFAVLVGLAISVLTLITMLRKEKEHSQQPYIRLKETVADHTKRIEKLEAAAGTNVVENRLMMKMQLALVRHAIDGNNIEGLRDMREQVQSYLIDK